MLTLTCRTRTRCTRVQYVLAKMVNHFSSFRSQKALRKTHFFENPFLGIWARVENSWEKPVFEQHFHKKQRFGKIARKSLVKINIFLVLSREAQNKTHFFENPFLRNRARVEKSREFSKNPFYRKPIFARTYCSGIEHKWNSQYPAFSKPTNIYAQVNILGEHEKVWVFRISQTLGSRQSLRNHNPESNYTFKICEVRNLC